jgi:hypothetical protein
MPGRFSGVNLESRIVPPKGLFFTLLWQGADKLEANLDVGALPGSR